MISLRISFGRKGFTDIESGCACECERTCHHSEQTQRGHHLEGLEAKMNDYSLGKELWANL